MIRRVPSGHNRVTIVGRWVIKAFRGHNADRRYWSEKLTREVLSTRGILHVPIVTSSDLLRTIVMQRAGDPPLATYLAPERIILLGDYTLKLAADLAVTAFEGFGWLDRPKRMQLYLDFGEFLHTQWRNYLRYYGPIVLGPESRGVEQILSLASSSRTNALYCLTDVAPKNLLYIDDHFIHYDLEGTLIAPRDFFLARTAVTLVRDAGDSPEMVEAARRVLACTEDLDTVRASFAFSFLRMLIYARVFGAAPPTPALRGLELVMSGANPELTLVSFNYASP